MLRTITYAVLSESGIINLDVGFYLFLFFFFMILYILGKYSETLIKSTSSRNLRVSGNITDPDSVIVYMVCSYDENYSIYGIDQSSLILEDLKIIHVSKTSLIFFNSTGNFIMNNCIIMSLEGLNTIFFILIFFFKKKNRNNTQ
jgi:hypothetical protein